ncbi:hypothetical protein BGP77_04780 [Saccharospirillum sp. MSK14-1]|uniref:type II secretion system protein GspJ n=1 Tax=Saccharospirillum sp. MSK14-1 TaxID=1897632 RepID=UPI000D3AEF84|nr:type II secretion system protein GspJ [Saccharospirillum sp. MSK14-1]PTY36614.1 hypothetical protein BGP77_04780 [Saccharospirillum sp. MSK14-1]
MNPMKHAGFTLIELLIALAISAILAVGTFYLVQTSRQTQTTLVERNEMRSQLTRVVRKLESDIRQWVPDRPVRDAFGQEVAALVVDENGLSLTRAGWARSELLELLTDNSSITPSKRSQLQRVRYRLAEEGSELCPLPDDEATFNESPQGCLIRSFLWQLDDDGRLEWQHQQLFRPIRALQFRFLGRVGDELRFFDNWPPDTPEVLDSAPILVAIEVKLMLPEVELERLIAVPMQREDVQEAADATS